MHLTNMYTWRTVLIERYLYWEKKITYQERSELYWQKRKLNYYFTGGFSNLLKAHNSAFSLCMLTTAIPAKDCITNLVSICNCHNIASFQKVAFETYRHTAV